MFYVIIIPAIIMTAYMWLYLRSLARHDKVLYKICQTRRDAMAYLRDNHDSISSEDYIVIKQFLGILNSVVNNYNKHKTVLFNFRKYIQFLKEYESFNNKANEITVPETPEIQQLHNSLKFAFLCGFLTYTPLIKLELVAKGILFLTSMLAKIGHNYVSHNSMRIYTTIKLVREQSSQLENCCKQY